MYMEMRKIQCSDIHEGICFSEPVYFEDGKNMFLPAGKQAKPFHIAALNQWKIPYLLTCGKEIDPKDYNPTTFEDQVNKLKNNLDDIEEIEELEDL